MSCSFFFCFLSFVFVIAVCFPINNHIVPLKCRALSVQSPLVSDLPHHRPKPLYVPVSRNNESTFCTRDQYLAPRVAFITWLVNFFLEKKIVISATSSTKNGSDVFPKIIQVGSWSMPNSRMISHLNIFLSSLNEVHTTSANVSYWVNPPSPRHFLN